MISQPQAAILGTYALVKRPWVIQDELGKDVIAIRPIMNITLTYDHRLVDGALAGRFLTRPAREARDAGAKSRTSGVSDSSSRLQTRVGDRWLTGPGVRHSRTSRMQRPTDTGAASRAAAAPWRFA